MGAKNRRIENYEIVRRAAEQKGDSDVLSAEKNLGSLLRARAHLLALKAQVQESIKTRISGIETGIIENEIYELNDEAKLYGSAAEEQEEASDDVYFKQINDLKENELKSLYDAIDTCQASHEERAALYADYDKDEDKTDDFRNNLLKHLAGNIVIKEHKIRYQKEQFDRFIASITWRSLKD